VSLDQLPLVAFDRIDDDQADRLLEQFGHWLGGCGRPFGRQSFALQVDGLGIVSVAVSASTVNGTCGGWPRQQVVELARQASHPDHRWATRVCLRLWRQVAPVCWAGRYWKVDACVSYHNRNRHLGNIYRFDGWTKVADVPGSVGGGTWTRNKVMEPKGVWVWEVPEVDRERQPTPPQRPARPDPAEDGQLDLLEVSP
jgi:hypothetical protein